MLRFLISDEGERVVFCSRKFSVSLESLGSLCSCGQDVHVCSICGAVTSSSSAAVCSLHNALAGTFAEPELILSSRLQVC